MYIPADVMSKHGLPVNTLLSGPKSVEEVNSLAHAVHEVASQAHLHLEEARALMPSLEEQSEMKKKKLFCAFFPAARSAFYLDALLKCDCDPFHPSLSNPGDSLWIQLRLLRLVYMRKI